MIRIGIIGSGRIAGRFAAEAAFAEGVSLSGVYGVSEQELTAFSAAHGIDFHTTVFDQLLDRVDAVYIASPHLTHYEYSRKAMERGRHVLCEKPVTLLSAEASELYRMAAANDLVFMEALKTACAPGFVELVNVCKSGIIGQIRNIDATFTKLMSGHTRELQKDQAGGSMTELSSYPLLAAVRLLGTDFTGTETISFFDRELDVDLFSRITLLYPGAVFTGKVGLGVKSEGDLIIAGTKGYVYVPSPWWKTNYFEARFEDPSVVQQFSFPFEGDGLRYELREFTEMIATGRRDLNRLTAAESVAIIRVIEKFLRRENVRYIA